MTPIMGSRFPSALPVIHIQFAAAGLGLALAALGGCAPPTPADRLPAGTLLLGRGDGFSTLLSQARKLAGTPLARTAEVAQSRVADCDEFSAFCPAGEECSLLDRLGCGAGGAELAPARELLGDAAWLAAASFAGGRVIARGRPLGSGGEEVDAEVALRGGRSALSLLLPAADGPGPRRLGGDETLVRLRLRPDGGLDVASLIPAEGMAARMFKLRSDLFVATALAGTWELAVYVPREGQLIPPVALALDFARRDLAVAAMERFVTQVTETWPVGRNPYAAGGHSGACLSDLKVLPELEPCYVATDDALIVGWNPPAVELAMSPSPAAASTLVGADESTLMVDLAHFPEADRRLAAAFGAGPLSPSVEYPWRSLRLRGHRAGDRYRFHAELEGW